MFSVSCGEIKSMQLFVGASTKRLSGPISFTHVVHVTEVKASFRNQLLDLSLLLVRAGGSDTNVSVNIQEVCPYRTTTGRSLSLTELRAESHDQTVEGKI